MISSHLKQAQVHIGDGVEGATGQKHHRYSVLHLVRHIDVPCSGHPASVKTKTHVRDLVQWQLSRLVSLNQTVVTHYTLKDDCRSSRNIASMGRPLWAGTVLSAVEVCASFCKIFSTAPSGDVRTFWARTGTQQTSKPTFCS